MKNEYCDKCGKMLIPAPAKFDGESTYVGFLDHKCAESQPETIEPERKWSDEDMIDFIFKTTKYYFRKSEEDIWFNGCDLLGEEPLTTMHLLEQYKTDRNMKDYKPIPSPEKQEEGFAAFEDIPINKWPSNPPVRREIVAEVLTKDQMKYWDMGFRAAQFKAPDNMVENHHVKHTQVTEEEIRNAARGGTIARTYSQQSHFIQGVQWLQSHPTTQPQASKDREEQNEEKNSLKAVREHRTEEGENECEFGDETIEEAMQILINHAKEAEKKYNVSGDAVIEMAEIVLERYKSTQPRAGNDRED